jgi:2-polyprenyl-3-methyl-5-hydroxy-6-metoxy-1,4-benzoquinol methylase
MQKHSNMNYQIEFKESLQDCPVCGSKENIKLDQLKNTYAIINDVTISISNPKKHFLMECLNCKTIYKSHYPDFETESVLTDIWKKNSNTRYQNKPSRRLVKIANFLKSYAKNKNKIIKVLDIGVGEGSYLGLLSDVANIELFIMDCDKNVLSRLETKLNAQLIHGDIGCQNDIVDFKETFDVITAFDLIEHIPSSNFLKNIHFMLKPGGYFLAETGNKDNWFCKFFGFKNWYYLSILEHKVFWSKQSLFNALAPLNYKKISISKVIHKDRRLDLLLKDFIKSVIWIIKIKLLRINIDELRNPKFPIRDQIFLKAKK